MDSLLIRFDISIELDVVSKAVLTSSKKLLPIWISNSANRTSQYNIKRNFNVAVIFIRGRVGEIAGYKYLGKKSCYNI